MWEDMMDMGECPVNNRYQGLYLPDDEECRRCGQCVSHCPTFRVLPIDAETPRQRLRSLNKILVEQQTLTEAEQNHLDHCLQCRVCETVCPSQVAYGVLYDAAQAKQQPFRKVSLLERLAFALIASKAHRRALLPWLALYQSTGLSKWLRGGALLRRWGLEQAERLSRSPALWDMQRVYAVKIRQRRGRVALFTGCLAEHFDRATLLAAIKVLNAIGYEVVVPPGQGCCGAIHQHNGRSAQQLILNNLSVFYSLEVEAVLYCASGCGAQLADYPVVDDAGQWFHQALQDVVSFIVEHWPEHMPVASSNLKVAVHEPCSQRNVLKNQAAVYALLAKIPGLNVTALADNAQCCGSGGSYMLRQPQIANQLRAAKWQAISVSGADWVVSSNFGCSFYLNAEQPDEVVPVLHPLQLLAERL